jgi:hypothetical protein
MIFGRTRWVYPEGACCKAASFGIETPSEADWTFAVIRRCSLIRQIQSSTSNNDLPVAP